MPQVKPPTRFLMRGSVLLILTLALWWWVLLGPLLFLMQGAGGFALSVFHGGSGEVVTVTPEGDWNLVVPLEATVQNAPDHPGLSQIHSVEFTVPRSQMAGFTFSLPVFWAIVLAAPGMRTKLRTLGWGTLTMAGVEILLLLVFVSVTAHQTAGQLAQQQGDFEKWLLRVGNYMVSGVVPYLAPFLMAIWLHPELRAEIMNWGGGAAVAAVEAPKAKQKQKRSAAKP
jgi:hypothetical protein